METTASDATTAAPRFALQDRVECNCGTWELGTVVGFGHTEERLGDLVCPYKVQLDDGREFGVPLDEDKSIRLYEKPEPEPEPQDDDDDDSDDDSDDDDEAGTEEERALLFLREAPDSKYLCINLKFRPREAEADEGEEAEPESKSQKTEEPAEDEAAE